MLWLLLTSIFGAGVVAGYTIGSSLAEVSIAEQLRITPASEHRRVMRDDRRGFTLIELLVVIVIVGLLSAVAMAAVLPAMRHRQVGEAARLVQSALAGCRDRAVLTGAPSGVRLVFDPAFAPSYTATGIDGSMPLAFNRLIPIEPAPAYSTGVLDVLDATTTSSLASVPCLAVAENLGVVGALNEPTSWWWNIRVGDRLQIGGGTWYTVCGPQVTANPEGFVNVGLPGTKSPLPHGAGFSEFLFLVNGLDDNKNGYIDEGYDGLDNDGINGVDDAGEWELEAWPANAVGLTSAKYTIQRRPAPVANSRELSLPTNIVIDASTWSTTRSRSRVPIDPTTGAVEILVRPDGSVQLQTRYGVPTSVGMDASFVHLWLAERSDVGLATPAGEWALVSLFTRSGRITTTLNPPVGDPFSAVQQGAIR
jgi:prepilin-type N-terminal cleavage/methylation domain-containing protein